MSKNEDDKAKKLITMGTEVAGSAVGGALGFFAAGPIGAAAGSVAGTLAAQGLELVTDFAYRTLSHREQVRVGAGIAFAMNRITQYLEEGRAPREDDFFDRDTNGRSTSDEILEGVLFKCKNEHEEKKTMYLGYIYANVAFMPDISSSGANWLLQIAQNLTYRQLCIISLVGQKMPGGRWGGPSYGPSDKDPAFEPEFKQLLDLNMFQIEYFDAKRRFANNQAVEFQDGDEIVGLSRIGELCFNVMGLDEVLESDLYKLKPRFPGVFE